MHFVKDPYISEFITDLQKNHDTQQTIYKLMNLLNLDYILWVSSREIIVRSRKKK